ncbi:MAG: type II toxin-antitoxin system RelE/ParE family toxin [Acidobacteriota bacterium]
MEKNPICGNNIKPLTGQLKGLIRYRVGDWRLIYRLFKEKKTVEIVAILPRGDAHRWPSRRYLPLTARYPIILKG